MPAPRMHPSGRIDVTSRNRMEGRLTCYGFGEHQDAINPGDLLIVGKQWLQENLKLVETEFVLSLRGRDMSYFVEHAQHAQELWVDNKNWLSAPMTRLRSESNLEAVRGYYERSSNSL